MCLFSNSIKFHKTPKLVKIDELKLSIKNVTPCKRGYTEGVEGGSDQQIATDRRKGLLRPQR